MNARYFIDLAAKTRASAVEAGMEGDYRASQRLFSLAFEAIKCARLRLQDQRRIG